MGDTTPVEGEDERLRAELECAHANLADAHKMASLGRLSAGIVHEINTPIGSIFSNNEVIARSLEKLKSLLEAARNAGHPPPDRSMELIDTIMSLSAVDKIACERIAAIVRSLKTFSRVDEGDIRKVDIHDMLRNTLKLTSTVLRRRIAIEQDFGDVPELECYPGLLNQVFLNLIVNAGQAIEGEGKITVRTRAEPGCVHVSISDTGRGIRREDRGKIFTRGFTTKPIGEGAGIGLAISREIVVDTHGGSIDFESEPGEGTTFHVRLPYEQPRKRRSES
jgi:signal transduction histidine kinase